MEPERRASGLSERSAADLVLPESLAQNSEFVTPTKRREMLIRARGGEVPRAAGSDGCMRDGKENSSPALRPSGGKRDAVNQHGDGKYTSQGETVMILYAAHLHHEVVCLQVDGFWRSWLSAESPKVIVEGHEATERRILDRISDICTPYRKQRLAKATQAQAALTDAVLKHTLTTPRDVNLRTAC